MIWKLSLRACSAADCLPLAPAQSGGPLGLPAHLLQDPPLRDVPFLPVGTTLYAEETPFARVTGHVWLPACDDGHALRCPLLTALTDLPVGDICLEPRKSGRSLAWVTLSDKGSLGLREDTSGPALAEMVAEALPLCHSQGFILPDEPSELRALLTELALGQQYDLILTSGGTGIASAVLMIIIGLAVVVFIVFMSNAERRIPVQYAKRVVGRKMYGGQSTHLPIKVNASGVMPIIFASSILSLPQTIAMFWQPETGTIGYHIMNLFSQTNPFYIVVYGLLILAFAYFYASIQFNPIEISNNLKKNGGFIPGFRPGKPTSDFIVKALGKVTFVGALFLMVVAILPLIVGAISPTLSNIALGGTSVIIVVGVALDTVKQLEAQMLMRHHKGFLE